MVPLVREVQTVDEALPTPELPPSIFWNHRRRLDLLAIRRCRPMPDLDDLGVVNDAPEARMLRLKGGDEPRQVKYR